MNILQTKHIIILMLSFLFFSSCRVKKKVFNGNKTLKCAEYKTPEIGIDENKKSKWRLVLYKDGNKFGGKHKRGKSRLFKRKK